MHDKKTTDKEIIKALECLEKDTNCGDCAVIKQCKGDCVFTKALDLINRQKAENKELQDLIVKYNGDFAKQEAEIERLKETTKNMSAYVKGNKWGLISFVEFCKNLKAEAYKEFAERLKEKLVYEHFFETEVAFLDKIEIDNLLKELVGDADAS